MGRGANVGCEGGSALKLVPAGAALQGPLLRHEARLQPIRKHDLQRMSSFAITASEKLKAQ